MKKILIPTSVLLLAMACGENEAKQASHAQPEAPPSAPHQQAPDPEATGETAEEQPKDDAASHLSYTNSASDVSANLRSDMGALDAPGTTMPSTAANGEAAMDRRAISSTAAVTGTDTNHRFIRTADLAFRVKNVVQATLGIEDIVNAHGGWIAHTRLHSEPRGTQSVPVSADSLIVLSSFEMMNTISLRVPDEELDVVLREIGAWVDLFDHRDIMADDIKLRMTANALAERRAKAHSQRLGRAIDDRGRRLRETVSAEEALLASDEKRDQNILHNLDIADRVAYSTVSLAIHQPTVTRREMKASDQAISAYTPSFGSRMQDALANGWDLIEILIMGLFAIWPIVLLLGGSLVLLWRKRKSGMRDLPPMVTPQA